MSGPATRPDEDPRESVNKMHPGFYTESTPVQLPQYEARFSVERDSGESIVSVTIVGSPRIIDLIMHAASDAFREDVEP
jgi:hypothetical protein